MQLCEYGCNRPGKHQFKNGKWCCSKSVLGCKKLSKSARGKKLYKRRRVMALRKPFFSPIAGHITLDSSWEIAYAEYLDKNNINWVRNQIMFPYKFGNRKRLKYYIPDFYLPDEQLYVEIKGYKTDKDDCKWRDFPKYYKLIVLFKEELEKVIGKKL